MLEKRQLISNLLNEFPQLGRRWEADSKRLGHDANLYLDISLFVHFLMDELYEKEKYQQVRAAFEQMEQFLRNGTTEVRE